MAPKPKAYRVLVGINYPPHGRGIDEKRADPDDIVDDLPPKIVDFWLAEGVIEVVD